MDELRIEDKLNIKLKNQSEFNGTVVDLLADRVLIQVESGIDVAKNLKELDDILVLATTKFGLKKMISSVITELNSKNELIIENSDSLYTEQKREFVRVNTDFKFKIRNNENENLDCKCVNISPGGIVFSLNDSNESFEISDNILIYFSKDIFEKDIEISAQIIKKDSEFYVAQYYQINKFDQDKIAKYVFKLTTKK